MDKDYHKILMSMEDRITKLERALSAASAHNEPHLGKGKIRDHAEFEIVELNWDTIIVYPRTEHMTGGTSPRETLRCEAELLYDEWVCDRRYDPRDVAKMILLHARERK